MDSALHNSHSAGVCLHITSLPGEFGIGELGENAKRFILSLEAMGFTVWQFLPTGPTGFGDSPYQLQSSFAGNELFIDISSLLRVGWLLEDEVEELRELQPDAVDFGRLIPLKRTALTLAAERFRTQAPQDQQSDFEAFTQANDAAWLHDYALYKVLKQRFDEKAWSVWPDEYRLRDAAALTQLEADEHDAITDVKVLQFLFRQQWDELAVFAGKHSVRLMGDMPFYIAYDSADAWAHPELLALDEDKQPVQVAGVPPDYFSADGQLWGNPVYDWAHHEFDCFAWWITRLRYALNMTDLVRIDHFRGFEAYWAVPAGAETARDGEWLSAPGVALFDALSADLDDLPIVAEDLGVITPEVDALRTRYGLAGMKVLQFELTEADFCLDSIDSDVVCYTGTHDNDTVQGWLHGSPGDERSAEEISRTREAVLSATNSELASAHLALFELALESQACSVIAPMQDLLGLGSESRLNRPGTAEGNWRWRFQPETLPPEIQELVKAMLATTERNTFVTQ